MRIREISLDEWDKLRDLYLELLKSDPNAFADEYAEVKDRSKEEWLEILGGDGAAFVAIEDKRFVGMGRVNFYEGLSGVPVLGKLGVLPEFRGRGIAKALVVARENWAQSKGAQKARVYVIADKHKTIEFSKKNGYEIVDTLPGNSHRKDGTPVDVVAMDKGLISDILPL